MDRLVTASRAWSFGGADLAPSPPLMRSGKLTGTVAAADAALASATDNGAISSSVVSNGGNAVVAGVGAINRRWDLQLKLHSTTFPLIQDGAASVKASSAFDAIRTRPVDATLAVAQTLESSFRLLDSFEMPWIPTSMFPPKVDEERLRRPGSSAGEQLDLVRLFFEHFDFPLGFIHPWTCFTEIKRIHPLLRLSICAAGARWSSKDPKILDWYYETAKNLCSDIIERPSLEAVQGVLLLALVSCRNNRRSDGWVRLGMACSMATLLELDALAWDPDIGDSWLPRETRRRVWWVCLITDKIYSVVLDRPLFLNHERYKVHKIGKEEVWRSLNDPSSPEHAVMMAHGAGSDLANCCTVLVDIVEQLLTVSAPSIEMLDESSTKYESQELAVEGALDDWFRRLPTRYIALIVDKANPRLPAPSDVLWPWDMTMFFGYHGCVCFLQRRRSFFHVLDIAALRAKASYELFLGSESLTDEQARRAAQERRQHNEQGFNKALGSAQAMAEMLTRMRSAGLRPQRLPHVVVFFALQGALILLLAEVLSCSTTPEPNGEGAAVLYEPPTYVLHGVLLPSVTEPPRRSPIAGWLAELVTVFDTMGAADRVADTLRRAADVVLHIARSDLQPPNLRTSAVLAPPPVEKYGLLRSPPQSESSPASSDTVPPLGPPVSLPGREDGSDDSGVSRDDDGSSSGFADGTGGTQTVTGARRLVEGFRQLADAIGRCLFNDDARISGTAAGGRRSDIGFDEVDDLLEEIFGAHNGGVGADSGGSNGSSGHGGGGESGRLDDLFFAEVEEKSRGHRSCQKNVAGGGCAPPRQSNHPHLTLSEEEILMDWLFTFKSPF
ncbi:hypothetical protein HK405_010390 [Cladochytrium tenue]|nr:hypothetical protein HK405_010390 [Cladochytrium tenue]